MTFYDEMQSVASEVLAEFKQGTVMYVKVTPGAGPVDNPGAPTKERFELDAAARGVAFKYVGGPGANGTTIIQSDLQLTSAVRADVTPDMNGFIEIGGLPYKIIALKPIPPVGVPVANVIIFRK